MKNKCILIILAMIAASHLLCAQIEKGSKMMGFNLNGTYNHTKDNTGFKTFRYNSSFGINPNVGFFVLKNTCVGFSTGYNFSKDFSNNYLVSSPSIGTYDTMYSSDKNVQNIFNLGLFIRKYFFLNDKFALAANLSTGFSYGILKNIRKSDVLNRSTYSYTNTFNVGLSPTMIFFPHPQYGIELSYGFVGYNYSAKYFNKKSVSESAGFKFNFGPSSLQLGFHYYMFKKSPKINK